MGPALDRFSSALVGWVPDLSRLPARRQVVVGTLLALALHLLLVPLIAGLLYLGAIIFPRHQAEPAPEPSATLALQVIQPKPAVAPVPTFEDQRQILDPRGLQASLEKPRDAKFESDRDLRAGSQSPATGALPLPSQQGRNDRPVPDFATQDIQISAVDNATAAVTAPEAEPAPAPAAPPPLYKPQPVAREALAKANQPHPDQKLPDPAREARATPPPQVAMLSPRQIAVARPSEAKEPAPLTRDEVATPVPRTAAQKRADNWMPMQSTPRPAARRDADRELLEKTQVDGAITNHGEEGVDAIATPAGRWWMLTKGAIRRNWYLFTDQRRDMISTGSVRISFSIDDRGKVHALRVQAPSGNHTLDEICLQAIRETTIPPPPAEVVDPLPNRMMEQDVTFNYY